LKCGTRMDFTKCTQSVFEAMQEDPSAPGVIRDDL
jgi:hypothetical protein